MAAKLYKAADVCDMTQLQPYVLRSWEKEFPGIGVQQTPDGPRVYRQSDVEQVLRIKQLVFGEGLTLAGARRRLEDPNAQALPLPASVPVSIPSHQPAPVEPASERLQPVDGYDELRARLASVREGLQGILDLLTNPHAVEGDRNVAPGAEEYQLASPADEEPAAQSPKVRKLTARRGTEKPAPVAKRKRASA
jgi:DNA-binding transcriptional MerR regulator